ncbi:MAG TPA: hypothetical protein VLG11_00455 [Candidatus Saccharimonadales bacterium]|nr:hypothetical protein [Candidatus Saccharimonadales bacterium]
MHERSPEPSATAEHFPKSLNAVNGLKRVLAWRPSQPDRAPHPQDTMGPSYYVDARGWSTATVPETGLSFAETVTALNTLDAVYAPVVPEAAVPAE